jgi:hypothetical protein
LVVLAVMEDFFHTQDFLMLVAEVVPEVVQVTQDSLEPAALEEQEVVAVVLMVRPSLQQLAKQRQLAHQERVAEAVVILPPAAVLVQEVPEVPVQL